MPDDDQTRSNARRFGVIAAVAGLTLLCAVSLSADSDVVAAHDSNLDQLNLDQEGAAIGMNREHHQAMKKLNLDSNLEPFDADQEGAAIGTSSELEDLKTNLVQEGAETAEWGARRRRRYARRRRRRRWMHSPRERNTKTAVRQRVERIHKARIRAKWAAAHRMKIKKLKAQRAERRAKHEMRVKKRARDQRQKERSAKSRAKKGAANRRRRRRRRRGLRHAGGYVYQFRGKCASPISSPSECASAAAALRLGDRTVSDDRQNGVSYDPKGCYFEGHSLKYNAKNTNRGRCTRSDKCLCKGTKAAAAAALSEADEDQADEGDEEGAMLEEEDQTDEDQTDEGDEEGAVLEEESSEEYDGGRK